jgi:hypothetical protein
MTAAQLAYGRRVVYRGLRGEIVNIRWSTRNVIVQVRLSSGRECWATPAELEVTT